MSSRLWFAFVLAGCAPDLSATDQGDTLRATFERGDVLVSTGNGAPTDVRMSLRSWGREGALAQGESVAPEEGDCVSDACVRRVHYVRDGLVEWWETRSDGLEQGFTVRSPPPGDGWLVFELVVEGAVVVVDERDGTAATFTRVGAGNLFYRGLTAWDEAGRHLPAWMEPTSSGVRLVVDDSDAVGTVTVDPLLTDAWTAESDQAFADFGGSVSSAGDVNGDGYTDVVVGAWSYDNGETDEGRAYLYLGSAAGLETTAAWTAESDQDSALFGSVSSAGDVNGDGYDDVVVGAWGYDNGETDEGRAYLYLGSAAGLEAIAAWTAESDQAFASFGSVSSAGDVNGDGYADVVVGADDYDNGESDEGRAFVYLGSAAGLAAVAAWTAESDQASARFGGSVSSAGDVNGDGYDDVLVGAFSYDNPQASEGRAYLYLGSAVGLEATAAWTAESNQAIAVFGNVSSAGDVNGDGYDDVVVGAVGYDGGNTDEGRAYLYLGSAVGLEATAAWTAEPDEEFAWFGYSVSSAGDVNGDGYGDVVIGAPLADHSQGRAYVYLGSAAGLEASEAWTVEPNEANAWFGWSASAGDMNGDGYADLVVGALGYDGDEEDEGRAYLYLSCSDTSVDADGDGVGDVCDVCPGLDDALFDSDADGVCSVEVNGLPADCDDGNAAIHPGAEEWCDGLDNACAGFVPADELDADGDGQLACLWDCDDNDAGVYLGNGALELCDGIDSSCLPWFVYEEADSDADGVRVCDADCRDNDAATYPGAPELCDGIDNGCAGFVPADEVDIDEDGLLVCAGDCDDGDPTSFPGAPELCDGLDNVCAGFVPADELDADTDGVRVCAGDCDDNDPASFPGAPELCDGLDNVCAGFVPADESDTDADGVSVCAGDCDDNDPASYPGAPELCDGVDNVCSGSASAAEADADADGVRVCHADCDDNDATSYPGAPEVCDGVDNTCAGFVSADEVDADIDGVRACAGDCDDADPTESPDVVESCGDGVDNNCDGAVDEECAGVTEDEGCGCDGTGGVGGTSVVVLAALVAFARRRRVWLAFGLAACAPDVSVDAGRGHGLRVLTETWTAESDQPFGRFGSSAASAGDVNGDAYGDLVVGAFGFDNVEADEGRAFLYLGSAAGLETTDSWTQESDQSGALFAYSVSSAGDVNGDAYGDVVVGALGYDNVETDEGRAFVYLGSATGLETSASWTQESDQSGAYFGMAVSSAGDVNGDGYGDVVVGAPLYDGQLGYDEGQAYLYLGSAAGLETTAAWTAKSDQIYAYFGWSVSSAGDVNGDGYGDVLVGSPFGGEYVEGKAYLYLGSSAGLETTAAWTAEGDYGNAQLGYSVSSAGDVNGDGYGDVVVSAPQYSNGEELEGRAYLYQGSAAGLETTAAWTVESDDEFALFGYSVASAGDVNGDGYGDVMVGAPAAGPLDPGWAYLYLGSPVGLETTAAWTTESNQIFSYFGVSVSSAGDVEGDGYGDVVVGASAYDNGLEDEGRAYLYVGGCPDADADGACGSEDCDDTDATVYPGAPELCDGLDNACAGFVPADEVDVDTDGVLVCAGDCDDSDPASYPNAPELCDGLDNACAGFVLADEVDVDTDGVLVCAGDCDDNDPASYPNAPELCDGRDNACAGSVPADEVDVDIDRVLLCAGDCDDSDPASYPNAPELCDGLDNACMGSLSADEVDADDDGWPACAGDCDDADRTASPVLSDQCGDGVDNDCDGEVDQDCEGPPPPASPPAEGCGCDGTGSQGGSMFLLALVASIARRRRDGESG